MRAPSHVLPGLHWVPTVPAGWQHVALWNWQSMLGDEGRQKSPALQASPAPHGWSWLPVGTSRQHWLPVEPLHGVAELGSDGHRQASPLAQVPFWLQRSPACPEGRQHLVNELLGPQPPKVIPEKHESPGSQVLPPMQGWPAAPGSRQHSWRPSGHCVGSCTHVRLAEHA